MLVKKYFLIHTERPVECMFSIHCIYIQTNGSDQFNGVLPSHKKRLRITACKLECSGSMPKYCFSTETPH